MWRGKNLARNMIFNCAYQRGLPASRMKNRLQQKSGRAFAISSGNSSHRDFVCRMSVEVRAHNGQRSPPMRDSRPGDIRARCVCICNHGCSSRCNRLLDESVTVARFAPHRYKNVPWFHLARVVLDTGDLRIPAACENVRSVQEIEKGHWSRLYCKVVNTFKKRTTLNTNSQNTGSRRMAACGCGSHVAVKSAFATSS